MFMINISQLHTFAATIACKFWLPRVCNVRNVTDITLLDLADQSEEPIFVTALSIIIMLLSN